MSSASSGKKGAQPSSDKNDPRRSDFSEAKQNIRSPTPCDLDDLCSQSKDFLVQRVFALERQLKIRNADCSRLLAERHELLPLRDECKSQKELIVTLQDKIQILTAQHASALESVDAMKKKLRDEEHQRRMLRYRDKLENNDQGPPPPSAPRMTVMKANPAPSGMAMQTPTPQRCGGGSARDRQPPPMPGGTIVTTSTGPQIMYDSSDISSVGFTTKGVAPCDFRRGPIAQQQHVVKCHGEHLDSEEGEEGIYRVMQMAREEAEMDVKYAEVQNHEEKELRDRFNALRERDGNPRM